MIAAHFPQALSLSRMKRTVRSRRWAPSVAAVVAFGAFGATSAYWALQLLSPPVAIAPPGSLVDYRSAPDLASAQALFGEASAAGAVAVAPGVEIRVLGVAASPARGSAVLVVDSGDAKAFLVGESVGTDLRLVEVRSDAAVLERNGVRIELPAPQRPSVALLSSGPDAAKSAGSASSVPPVGTRAPASASTGERGATERDARALAAETPPADRPSGAPDGGSPPQARPDAVPPAAPADLPDDPAIDAATLSPRGAPVANPSALSGIRADSVRTVPPPGGAPR